MRALAPRLRHIGVDAVRFDYMAWRIALALGDSAGARAVAERLDSLSDFSRNAIAGDAQWLGERLEDAERAVAIGSARAATAPELSAALVREHDLAMNRGLIHRAQAALRQLPPPSTRRDLLYVRDALFSDGDPDTAEAAAARLRPIVAAPQADTAWPGWRRAQIECTLAWWDLARGRASAAATGRERLRHARTDAESPFNTDDVAYCGAVLDAWLATGAGRRDVRALIQRADSINIFSTTTLWDFGNMLTAPLKERAGDSAGALVSWRRVFLAAPDISDGYISTCLRETARVGLLAGDSTLARDYYRRYLGLRASADPALRADVECVRAELARITGEPPAR